MEEALDLSFDRLLMMMMMMIMMMICACVGVCNSVKYRMHGATIKIKKNCGIGNGLSCDNFTSFLDQEARTGYDRCESWSL